MSMNLIKSPYPSATVPSITTPSDLADIWEWWEPELEGLADNDPIGQLTGQVSPGTGHNFTQGTAAEKPTYKANIVNGRGVARFDGIDNWLSGVNTTALSQAHVFIVVKSAASPSASGQGGLWSGNANPAYAAPGTPANTIHESLFRTTRVGDLGAGVALTNWRVYEIVSTASEYTLRIDGATPFFSAGGNFGTDSNLRLGNNGPSFTEWFNGDVAGFYICSAKQTTMRPAIINYLNDRFATSAV